MAAPMGHRRVRIVSFNVGQSALNRTVQKSGSLGELMKSLQADILCIQEVKNTRPELRERYLLAEGSTTFVSLNRSRSVYAGVATIVGDACPALSVEEGITGALAAVGGGGAAELAASGHLAQLQSQSLHSSASNTDASPGLGPNKSPIISGSDTSDSIVYSALELDSEGRALITDHGAFVLINTYCPAVTSDDPEEAARRKAFKRQFHAAVAARVQQLHAAGRRVILLGDLNVSHTQLDHCDPQEWVRNHGGLPFESAPFRQWIDALLRPDPLLVSLALQQQALQSNCSSRGSSQSAEATGNDAMPTHLVDAFRVFHPQRQGAFTCWNKATSARQTNYGTRLDYTLVSNSMIADGRSEPQSGSSSSSLSSNPASSGLTAQPSAVIAGNETNANTGSVSAGGVSVSVCDADIMQSFAGSDHCPVYVALDVSWPAGAAGANSASASANAARDAAAWPWPSQYTSRHPHPLSANAWPEFSKKQQSLKGFFASAASASSSSAAVSGPYSHPTGAGAASAVASTASSTELRDGGDEPSGKRLKVEATAAAAVVTSAGLSSSGGSASFSAFAAGASLSAQHSSKSATTAAGKKGGAGKPSSSSASLFAMGFVKKGQSTSASAVGCSSGPASATFSQSSQSNVAAGICSSGGGGALRMTSDDDEVEVVDLLSLDSRENSNAAPTSSAATAAAAAAAQPSPPLRAASPAFASSSSSAPSAAGGGGGAWSQMLTGPMPPPLCRCGIPSVQREVKKASERKGSRFYVCVKPQGKAGDPAARCNFFMWHDEWVKAAKRGHAAAGGAVTSQGR